MNTIRIYSLKYKCIQMKKDVKPKRAYHSTRRTQQAIQTQRDIVEAARLLFIEQGYAATAISQIAQTAGVSAETIYATFGSKRAILARLIDVSLSGDYDASPILERDWVETIRQEPNQRQRLKLLVHKTRVVYERAGPIHAIIRSAAASDAEIAALRQTHQEQRLQGQTEFVRILAAAGPLRKGLTIESAADTYWVLVSPDVYNTLTIERGWSADRYETWLLDALIAQLLPNPIRGETDS